MAKKNFKETAVTAVNVVGGLFTSAIVGIIGFDAGEKLVDSCKGIADKIHEKMNPIVYEKKHIFGRKHPKNARTGEWLD